MSFYWGFRFEMHGLAHLDGPEAVQSHLGVNSDAAENSQGNHPKYQAETKDFPVFVCDTVAQPEVAQRKYNGAKPNVITQPEMMTLFYPWIRFTCLV